MKKVISGSIILFTAVLFSLTGFTQKINTVQDVKRPDLAISEVRVIEATRNPSTGLHKVKVAVTIRNNGDAAAGGTSLRMLVQNQLLNAVAPTNNQPANPWYPLGENQPVRAIAPGQPLTSEYVFTETKKIISTARFNMGLVADGGNVLKEVNETDNRSAEIVVDPEDRTEYIAVTPVREVSVSIARVDTFQYTIGRADFHLQSKARTTEDMRTFFESYIETNPHGITIKRMGGAPTVRNVILAAPLHLPAGAVIRRVKFNYIKLSGTEIVPHLALRSYHQAANNEGWGLSTPITSYWVTSPSRDGTSGYRVMSSTTAAGFNMTFDKNSTYHFEILGADARSTRTPEESEWPTNDKIFIWSIQVFYTL